MLTSRAREVCPFSRGGREAHRQTEKDETHSDPTGNQIDFVENVDDLLAALLFGKVFLDRLAARAQRVSSVEDMKDHIRGVDDLQKGISMFLQRKQDRDNITLYSSPQMRLEVPAERM